MSPGFMKRYRMEINLLNHELPRPVLPANYVWCRWSESLLTAHALAKYESFEGEADRQLFLSLCTYVGCEELMKAISQHPTFLPQATWLIAYLGEDSRADRPESSPSGGVEKDVPESPIRPATQSLTKPCATIQGLVQSGMLGSIQNVGVVPEHRGLGLGKSLLLKCLRGFRSTGRERITLDVSASNQVALALYQSVGFQVTNTSYKQVR